MANVEALEKRLLEEAREEAAEIKAEGKERARKIEKEAQKRAQEESEAIIDRAREEAEEIKDRNQTMARLEGKKELLTQKQLEIQALFNEVMEEIQQLDRDRYTEIITEMLLEQAAGEAKVIFSPRDREELGTEFIAHINKKLKSSGKKGELKLSEESREIKAGFILKEKGVENNNSFEELLSIQREELEAEVARVLFK